MYRSMILFAPLFLSPALAASPSPAVTGEWLAGPAFPAAVYEGAFEGATTSGARLLLRSDGRYTRTELNFSYTPGFFGSYVVTCGTLEVHAEVGRYTVAGNRIQFQPEQTREISDLSPSALNAGCKRNEGNTETLKTAPYQATFALSGTQLSVNIQGTRRSYAPRPAGAAAANQPVPAPTPRPTATASPLITSQSWTATGTWDARIDVQGNPLMLRFNLYDDGEQSLSGSGFAGNTYVAWLLGARGGVFEINLDTGEQEVKLRVEGRFTDNRYEGTFRIVDDWGTELGRGTLNMSRDN